MPDTVVGLFKTRTDADRALGKLKESGFGPEHVAVATPGFRRRGHYFRKVLIGIVVGTAAGALVGAIVTGLTATVFIGAAAGAVTGLVAGMLLSMAASGDQALFYEQEVESGRILITVSGSDLERAREVMRAAGAMESSPVEAPLERPRPESG